MATCGKNLWRHAARVFFATSMVASVICGLVVPRASADQISDLKAKAAALASQIDTLGRQEEALSERYDAAQIRADALQAQLVQAAQQVAAAEASANKAKAVLKQDAVDAYVNGGNSSLASSAGTQLASANESLLRAEYVSTLAADQSDAADRFRLAALQDHTAKANLQRQQASEQAQLAQVGRDREAGVAVTAQLETAQREVTGQVAALVAQQQAAERAAAARAAAQRLAVQRTVPSARALLVSEPNNNVLTVGRPLPPGHGAAGAVAAAESRVGDWYEWGAAGPDRFDCSGLFMWAYEQVGISLPHYSGDQYAGTTHIPMSDLQPGDLVFPSDPGEHVAMYVGDGQIVVANHTGTQIDIEPMSSWYVLASRVE